MQHESEQLRSPEIITLSRVRLRRARPSDALAVFQYASDPEVVRYMDWPICCDISQIEQALSMRDEEWRSGEGFTWVLTEISGDTAIGGASCRIVGHSVEFGYLINRHYWGNGYATEISKAIVDWALSQPVIWRVYATCDAENHASARVLEKACLQCEGVIRRAIVRPNIAKEPRDAFMYAVVRQR